MDAHTGWKLPAAVVIIKMINIAWMTVFLAFSYPPKGYFISKPIHMYVYLNTFCAVQWGWKISKDISSSRVRSEKKKWNTRVKIMNKKKQFIKYFTLNYSL